jgi:hypothetical protein
MRIEKITTKDDRLVTQAAAAHLAAASHANAPPLMQMLAQSLGASDERDDIGARQFHGHRDVRVICSEHDPE